MPTRKKKFIDKKNAVTFHLVHRSQKDPLIVNENAPTGVLLATTNKSKTKKEEQMKFGVYYDDDYDYLQHLKDTNEICGWAPADRFRIDAEGPQKLQTRTANTSHSRDQESTISTNQSGRSVKSLTLPSSVFGSELETGVGLLNKAVPLRGPQLEWDPDIVEALDDDFNFDDPENQLEDDFVAKANAIAGVMSDSEEMEYDSEQNSDEDVASDAEYSDENDDMKDIFEDEETKSQFTHYSLSSSVIRRNDGLVLLDDQFERFFEQYDDTEIGSLDQEEVDGSLTQRSTLFDNILVQFEKENTELKMEDVVGGGEIKAYDEMEEESDNEKTEILVEDPKEKWDCESILSTYSTLYNHPKTINEPQKDKKIKLTSKINIPVAVLPTQGLTSKQIEKEFFDSHRQDKADTFRPRGETSEEKRIRKKSVKQERKERRIEKKMNKISFNEEKLKQQKEELNAKKNFSGMSIS